MTRKFVGEKRWQCSGKNRFKPDDDCTRAQIAQMVYNFEKKVVK